MGILGKCTASTLHAGLVVMSATAGANMNVMIGAKIDAQRD